MATVKKQPIIVLEKLDVQGFKASHDMSADVASHRVCSNDTRFSCSRTSCMDHNQQNIARGKKDQAVSFVTLWHIVVL